MPPDDDPTAREADAPDDLKLLAQLVAEQGSDIYLAALVAAMNASRAGFDVTVLVGGYIVSGVLESGEQWFEAQRTSFEESGLGDLSVIFDHPIAQYRESREWAESTPVEDLTDEDRERVITVYLHLRDVAIRSPDGGVIEPPGMRWRCRLAAVDGWMFGRLKEG